MKKILILFLFFIITENLFAFGGNKKFESFNKAKKELSKLYLKLDNKTIYCRATFNGNKITNKNGFVSVNNSFRDSVVEWEHIVPAKKFGENFDSWRKGHELCFDIRGNKLGNRDCAQKVDKNFRRMQADLYNLYPAIGTVNIMRLDYDFVDNIFDGKILGKCKMKIGSGKVVPPNYAKGKIARAYLYMKEEYPFKMKLTYDEKKRFEKWNELYPPTKDECKRGELIKRLQGNENKVLSKSCKTGNNNSKIDSLKSKFFNLL